MQNAPFTSIVKWTVEFMLTLVFATITGCNNAPRGDAAAVDSQPAQIAGQPGVGQPEFISDDAAAAALLAAAKLRDREEVRKVLGPATKEMVSGDAVEDANAFAAFAQHADEGTRLEKRDGTTILHIGKGDWPFAIPIVKAADGKWFFDTAAGKQEILARRIGGNELETIKVCHAYVAAQREYASVDRDGSEVLKYAQHMMSKPGTKAGLYWAVAPGETPSPFGPMIADASAEGYNFKQGQGPQPFHGYYFHILKAQGSAAPGGKYSYIINGNMIAGFALVAFPAEYRKSGVMTFIVSHQGKVYQKDLGPDTTSAAKAMTEYNPDPTWTLVRE